MEVGLVEQVRLGWRLGLGILNGCTFVPQDGRIQTTVERCIPATGLRSNPIVADLLVGVELKQKTQMSRITTRVYPKATHHKRVPLGGKNLDLFHSVLLAVHAVDLNDRHFMVVDGEHVIGVTGHGDEPNAIPVH